MWSQEFRVRSPAGGPFEWETGVYYQVEQLDLDPAHNFRANIRRPSKKIKGWGDNRWTSAFATVTYNFLDDKASIDVGGRYTDVHKESFMQSLAQTLIFDIDPDPDGDLEVLDTPGTGSMDMGDDIIDCATGHRQCGSFGAGFWTHAWRLNFVPAQWDTQEPVAFGPALDRILRNIRDEPAGILTGIHNDDSFDPQVVFRYRPTPTISTYAKWAKAFKAGGFDTGHKSPPRPDEFEFPAETAENFEVGAKGSLLDGRAQYNATLFWMTITAMPPSPVRHATGDWNSACCGPRRIACELACRVHSMMPIM
jgi:outer membrane receptor protein involved in Fe transport